jgi:hypothetical protein
MATDGEGARSTPRTTDDVAWLKEFVLRVIDEHDKRFTQEITGIRRDLNTLSANVQDAKAIAEKMLLASDEKADKALLKAETATNDRLAGMNEIRRSMNDREKAFAPIGEITRLDEKISSETTRMDEKVTQLANSQRDLLGDRRGSSSTWQSVTAVLALLIALAAVIVTLLPHKP